MKKTVKQELIDLAHGLTMNHTSVEEGIDTMTYVKECLPRFMADIAAIRDANADNSAGCFLRQAWNALDDAMKNRTKRAFLLSLEAAITSLDSASKRPLLCKEQEPSKPSGERCDANCPELEKGSCLAECCDKPFADMTSLEKNIHNERFILEGHKAALKVLEEARPFVNYTSQLVMKKAIESSERWLKELEAKQAKGETAI